LATPSIALGDQLRYDSHIQGLRRCGVEAFSARDMGKLGLTDEEQVEAAAEKQSVIFAHDVDFL